MSDTTGEPVGKTVSFTVRPRTPGNGARPNAGGPRNDARQTSFIDPATAGELAGEPGEPAERVKRGRPPGGGSGAGGGAKATGKAAGASLDLSAAAGLLQGFHAVIAMRRGPHWLLNDADAKAYGLALSNALRHLPVTMAQKYVDFAALGVAVCCYEGPRIAMDMHLRNAAGRGAAPRPQGPAQVFAFRPMTAPPPPPSPGPMQTAPPQPVQAPPGAPGADMTYEPDLTGGAA